MANRKNVPTAATIEREKRVLELRRAGVTFDAIAEQLAFADRGAAYKAFTRALARTLQQPAAELRELELDRLDRLQAAVWAAAMRGDLKAIDRILRIAERRARLMGLDHTDGIAERQVRLQEEQGALIAHVISKVLDSLLLTPEQRALVPQVVPREIRAVVLPPEQQALVPTVVPRGLRANKEGNP